MGKKKDLIVRFAGDGGQGVVTSAEILAKSAAQAGFHVLVGQIKPNVLIEAGFLSNKNETKLLGQSRYRQKIAEAIFSALVNFKDKYENPLIGDN